MFSRAGIWTIAILGFFAIWAGTFAGALAVKEHLMRNSQEAPEITKPFAFAEPTEEELAMMAAETIPEGTIAIPMSKAITVFSCAKRNCSPLGKVRPGEELILREDATPDADGWIPIEWTAAEGQKAARGYVNVNDVATGYQPPPPPPAAQAGLDPETVLPQKDVPEKSIPIDPQTLVGIACEFESDDQFRDKKTTRGSGAIITNDGYIITARSVVDLGYLNDGLDGFKLKQCYAGQLPASEPLPSAEAIRTINAFVRIPYMTYLADVSYIPKGEDASDYENAWMDFALLKITDINPDVKYFGGPTRMPESFPAAPFLISELPKIGDETLNFAFPSGTTLGHNSDIKTLFMQGLISSVTGYWAGDKRYADSLFLIENHLDTEDTAGGRFGSPIFWKGYVVGVHTGKQQASRQIYNVSAKAVLENLFDNQFIIPIDVR